MSGFTDYFNGHVESLARRIHQDVSIGKNGAVALPPGSVSGIFENAAKPATSYTAPQPIPGLDNI